jgi:hypothetical protein
LIDFPSQVIQAIDGWLQHFADGMLQPGLQAVGGLLFRTPLLSRSPDVIPLAGTLRGIANSLFVLAFMVCGGLVITSTTFETGYTLKRVLPRLVFAVVLANSSLGLCEQLTQLNNWLVVAILGPTPSEVWSTLVAQITTSNLAGVVIFIALGVVAGAMAVFLNIVYLARGLVLVALTIAAPVALATYSLPHLEEIAQLWWRAYVVTLFLQVGHAVLIDVGVHFALSTTWLGGGASPFLSALMLVAVLYLMVRLPFLAYQVVLRPQLARTLNVRIVNPAQVAG